MHLDLVHRQRYSAFAHSDVHAAERPKIRELLGSRDKEKKVLRRGSEVADGKAKLRP